MCVIRGGGTDWPGCVVSGACGEAVGREVQLREAAQGEERGRQSPELVAREVEAGQRQRERRHGQSRLAVGQEVRGRQLVAAQAEALQRERGKRGRQCSGELVVGGVEGAKSCAAIKESRWKCLVRGDK